MRTVTIFGEHGIVAHIPQWLSQFGALELHYPMIQYLIKGIIRDTKMASITRVGHLYYRNSYTNSEFLWELRKTWFCEGSCK